MGVGVLVGLLLGPRSPLFSKDTLVYPKRGKAKLWTEPGPEGKRLPVTGPEELLLAVRGQQRVQGVAYYQVRYDWRLEVKAGGGGGAQAPPVVLKATLAYVKVAQAPEPVSRVGHRILSYLGPLGRLFLRLIKMVIVPLVFASLLLGVASLGSLRSLGRMGGVTLGYFMITTVLAITIGLVLVNTIRPGSYVNQKDRDQLSQAYAQDAKEKTTPQEPPKTFLDRLVDMVPDVPLWSLSSPHPNMLQIILFAIILGIGFILIPADRAQPALAFFQSINDVMIKIVEGVMELAPYGVLALLAVVSGTAGVGVLRALAVYSAVVVAALFVHGTLTYGLALKLVARYPLRRFYGAIRPAQLIAFSTSSSSATLPVSIEVAQKNLGVSNRAASFVLPLGATVNMDGTALYQGIAAVFIAQVFGPELGLSQQLQILLTATLASVGAAGVPGAGIITLAMVLHSVGVNPAGIALILGVDRLLDMFRTGVNVTGDLSAAVIVARLTGELEDRGGGTSAPTVGEHEA